MVDIAQLAASGQLGSNPAQGSWMSKPMNQGAGGMAINPNGLFTGNIGGPFGLGKKPPSPQRGYEQQRMSQMRNEADQIVASNAASAHQAMVQAAAAVSATLSTPIQSLGSSSLGSGSGLAMNFGGNGNFIG